MLKKRFVGVITVKNGWAVQSMGYNRYLPIGAPEVLAENLDRWGADEIFLQCIDRSAAGLGPDFELLERVGKSGLGTPLIYGGGIRSVEDGVKAVKLGADRVCVDALLADSPDILRKISLRLGAQAIIGALPLSMDGNTIMWLDYRSARSRPLAEIDLSILSDKAVSEALIVDWKHEGEPGGFDMRLIEEFPLVDVPLIAFGGLSEAGQMRSTLEHSSVVAVAVGNFLNYREHAVLHYKEQLSGLPIRMPKSVGEQR